MRNRVNLTDRSIRAGFVDESVNPINTRNSGEVLKSLKDIIDKEALFTRVSKEGQEELEAIIPDGNLSCGLIYFERNGNGKYTVHYWKSNHY